MAHKSHHQLRRKQVAQENKSLRENRSTEEQIIKLRLRPGKSKKEMNRLMK